MKTLAVLVLVLPLTSCVGIMTGKYPVPAGEGVEVKDDSVARVVLPDYTADIRVGGHGGDFALIGLIVPFIPLGQWKWLMGIGPEDLRTFVTLKFLPTTGLGEFWPSSLRLVVGGQEHYPELVAMGPTCSQSTDKVAVPSGPLVIDRPACLKFHFESLVPPKGEFSIQAEGLPSVTYSLQRKTRFAFVTQ